MKSLHRDCQFLGLPGLLVGRIPPGTCPVVPESNYYSTDDTFRDRLKLENPSKAEEIFELLVISQVLYVSELEISFLNLPFIASE